MSSVPNKNKGPQNVLCMHRYLGSKKKKSTNLRPARGLRKEVRRRSPEQILEVLFPGIDVTLESTVSEQKREYTANKLSELTYLLNHIENVEPEELKFLQTYANHTHDAVTLLKNKKTENEQ